MKILIAYAGRVGVAKECAELLEKELCGREVTLCDLREETPSPENFDAVVVGSAIYFGKAEKTVRSFLKANAKELENNPEVSERYIRCYNFGPPYRDLSPTLFMKMVMTDHYPLIEEFKEREEFKEIVRRLNGEGQNKKRTQGVVLRSFLHY